VNAVASELKYSGDLPDVAVITLPATGINPGTRLLMPGKSLRMVTERNRRLYTNLADPVTRGEDRPPRRRPAQHLDHRPPGRGGPDCGGPDRHDEPLGLRLVEPLQADQHQFAAPRGLLEGRLETCTGVARQDGHGRVVSLHRKQGAGAAQALDVTH